MAIESLRWYPCALEQTVIESTLINFCTLSPSLSSHTSVLHTGGSGVLKCVCRQLFLGGGGFCDGNLWPRISNSTRSANAGFTLTERAEIGMLETHHFAKWSFVLLGCIIKSSL